MAKKADEKKIEEIRERALDNYKKLLKKTRTKNKWIRLGAELQEGKLANFEIMQEMVFADDFEEIMDLIDDADEYEEFYIGIINDDSLKA